MNQKVYGTWIFLDSTFFSKDLFLSILWPSHTVLIIVPLEKTSFDFLKKFRVKAMKLLYPYSTQFKLHLNLIYMAEPNSSVP